MYKALVSATYRENKNKRTPKGPMPDGVVIFIINNTVKVATQPIVIAIFCFISHIIHEGIVQKSPSDNRSRTTNAPSAALKQLLGRGHCESVVIAQGD